MLSVSSLVHSYCKSNGGCENALEIKKVISILENKVGSSCKVTDTNFKSVSLMKYRVKSGKLGHQVNSDIHLQTV